MTRAFAFRGFHHTSMLSIFVAMMAAMLLLSCQANAHQNIK